MLEASPIRETDHGAEPSERQLKGTRMRAVNVDKYGGSPVLVEVPTPRSGLHEVLIKLQGAGINPMGTPLSELPSAAFPGLAGSPDRAQTTSSSRGETP
jgi:hypothetical protein